MSIRNPRKVFLFSTAISQIIAAITVPLLTYFTDPALWGSFGRYFALFSILNTIGCLRLELGIPREPKDVIDSAGPPLVIGGAVSVVALFLLLGFTLLSRSSADEKVVQFGFMAICASYLYVVYRIFTLQLIRDKKLIAVSVARIFFVILTVGLQALFVILGFQSPLESAHLLACLFSMLFLAMAANVKGIVLSWAKLRSYIKTHFAFVKYSLGADFFAVAGNQLPVLAAATFLSPSAAGLFFVAHRIGVSVVSIGAEASSKLILVDTANADPWLVRNKIAKHLGYVTRVFLVPLSLASIAAAPLAIATLPEEWWSVSRYLTPILLLSLVQLYILPCLSILLSTGKQWDDFVIQATYVILRFSLLAILLLDGSFDLYVWAHTIISSGFLISILFRMQRIYGAVR